MLWLVTVITYCKVLNPMIFMTKEYFMQRVLREEDLWVVQELVELVEDWRFCRRLQIRRRCQDAREAARRIPSGLVEGTSVVLGVGQHVEVLVKLVREQLQ